MRIRMAQYAIALMLSGMVLAACEATLTEGACGANEYQGLVGQPLAAVTLPAEIDARIIGPDTAVTMDHRPDRLNIALNGSGIIERVYCG